MARLILRDDQWDRISQHIIGDERTRGTSGRDNRLFVEAGLWIVRTGSPWRDLPEAFGNWNSVFRRFNRWSPKGVWQRIFEAMSDDADFEYLIVDSTIIRAHQHALGGARARLPGSLHPHRRPNGRCSPVSTPPRAIQPPHAVRGEVSYRLVPKRPADGGGCLSQR